MDSRADELLFLEDVLIVTGHLVACPSSDHAERLHRIIEQRLEILLAASQSAWDGFLGDHPELR